MRKGELKRDVDGILGWVRCTEENVHLGAVRICCSFRLMLRDGDRILLIKTLGWFVEDVHGGKCVDPDYI